MIEPPISMGAQLTLLQQELSLGKPNKVYAIICTYIYIYDLDLIRQVIYLILSDIVNQPIIIMDDQIKIYK